MDNEKCRLLIKLYGSKGWLWNSRCADYHNKSLREDAWKDISAEMGIPIPDLKKKMASLQASYKREKSRIAKSLITGSGIHDVYVSKWFAFDDFDFMKDKDVPNPTSDTMPEDVPPSQNDVTTDDNNDKEPVTQSATEKPVEKPKENYKVPDNPKKRTIKRKQNSEEENPMLKKAFEILTNLSIAIN